MLATLHHRGPDDGGLHTDPGTGVSIGARRLAILDIDGGHQPLCGEDGSVWVAFNGEIYNHEPLREDLRRRGHTFSTGCDTEVLVHLYEEFGDALVHALEGMFAFALWDERRQRLLLARDRFGEKPLFIHEHAGELMFASELTALLEAKPQLRALDPAAIDAFFVLGYVPGPGTIVRDVRQLAPGHLLSWERESGVCSERAWWSPPDGPVKLREPVEMLAAEAERLLHESVRTRMIADVPVGVFLSGGIDSRLVAASAAQQSTRRIQTFTIGYDVGSFDETVQARRVADELDTEHHEITLTQTDVAARAPALLASLDQPLADQALIPLHALSEFARPRVTVALGGEGADELFGGYPRYRWLERAERIESALPRAVVGPLGELLRYSGRWPATARLSDRISQAPVLERHLDWVTAGRRHHRKALYGPRLTVLDDGRVLSDLVSRAGNAEDGSIGRRLMRLDQIDYLPDDVLVKADRAGMLVSLEIRSVYLHRGLAELAGSIDTSLHLSGQGKTLLHSMLPKGMAVNSRTSTRYRKTAFRAPAAEWLRGPLAAALHRQLEHGMIFKEGYFNREAARELAREHISLVRDHSDLLWPLLALGLWVDRFFGVVDVQGAGDVA
ncbi:MAG TPA: asparagine synthase (glutamine-hydrolyzing) [Solirubrobacteraceae bacterium]|nr:asparagine synthase (glutamine-hydrolyzing) [Solirubrobacteraceae bacterium]